MVRPARLPTPRPRRPLAALLALFVLAFGLSLQVGHRAAVGDAPGMTAGAWMVVCGPAGKVLLPLDGDDPSRTPQSQLPYCPVCATLHAAVATTPLPQGPAIHAPASCAAVVYAEPPGAAPSKAPHSRQTARGPPVVA